MKSLATVAVIATFIQWTTAFAADSQTQVIECNDGEPLITVTMQVEGSKILEAELEIHHGLMTGLYRGQSTGDEEAYVYEEKGNDKLVGLLGVGWDVSADDPAAFRIAFSKDIVGKGRRRGSFDIYMEAEGPSFYRAGIGYGVTAKDLYEALKGNKRFEADPAESMFNSREYCHTYIKRT